MKLKPLPKKKHQRLIIGAAAVVPQTNKKPKENKQLTPAAVPRYRISRKAFRNILREAAKSVKLRREPDLKYPTLHPSVMKALRNSNVRFGNLNAEWIEDYRTQAVEAREVLLRAALEAMAYIEATRKTSDNLIYDYGLPYGLDATEMVNVVMKVLSMRSMEIFTKDLPESVRTKMLELYAEQLFSAVGRGGRAPYKLAPSNSPFKIGNPLIPDGFSVPIAGQSLSETQPAPPPSAGRNYMPPRGLTL